MEGSIQINYGSGSGTLLLRTLRNARLIIHFWSVLYRTCALSCYEFSLRRVWEGETKDVYHLLLSLSLSLSTKYWLKKYLKKIRSGVGYLLYLGLKPVLPPMMVLAWCSPKIDVEIFKIIWIDKSYSM